MTSFVPGVLLALGTITAIPVPPPSRVDRGVARVAVLAMPFAVLPVTLAAAGLAGLLVALGVPSIGAGFVAVIVLVGGTRAIHQDGLADTFDALGVPGDRARALDIMKRGDVGPMGATSLVLVIGLQAVCVGDVLTRPWGWLIVALGWAAARAAVGLACTPLVPPARPGGLGQAVSGTVPVWAAIVSGLLWAGVVAATTPPGWGGLAVVAGLVAVSVLLVAAVRRFGGMTGDILGASVEIGATVIMLGLTIAT